MPPEITFITRHYPPNPNINGESVRDMVKYLEEEWAVESRVICIDRGFEGGGEIRASAGIVTRIRTPYEGKNPLLRFIAFLYDGYALARTARRAGGKWLICTTSPPLLPLWVSRLCKRRVSWVLWSFDLFPEGFKASGQIGERNVLYRWAKRLSYKWAPSMLIALGPMQAQYLQQQYGTRIPVHILPCGLLFYQDRSEARPAWYGEDRIYFGYCGNLGDPHNPEFLKAVIDHIDPERHRLVLAIYGNQADAVKKYADGKPGIILVDRVPRNQLHFIDVHLVTLRDSWTHVAVPSKAVSAVSLGCPILFCGSSHSDNWYMLKEAGWLIPENDEMPTSVKKLMDKLDRAEIEDKKQRAATLNGQLKEGFMKSYADIARRFGGSPEAGVKPNAE